MRLTSSWLALSTVAFCALLRTSAALATGSPTAVETVETLVLAEEALNATAVETVETFVLTEKALDDMPGLPVDFGNPAVQGLLAEQADLRASELPPTDRNLVLALRERSTEELKAQTACPVCLSYLNAESLATLSCAHVIHESCFQKALRARPAGTRYVGCPTCREASPHADRQRETPFKRILDVLESAGALPPVLEEDKASVILETLAEPTDEPLVHFDPRQRVKEFTLRTHAYLVDAIAAAEAQPWDRAVDAATGTPHFPTASPADRLRLLQGLKKAVQRATVIVDGGPRPALPSIARQLDKPATLRFLNDIAAFYRAQTDQLCDDQSDFTNNFHVRGWDMRLSRTHSLISLAIVILPSPTDAEVLLADLATLQYDLLRMTQVLREA